MDPTSVSSRRFPPESLQVSAAVLNTGRVCSSTSARFKATGERLMRIVHSWTNGRVRITSSFLAAEEEVSITVTRVYGKAIYAGWGVPEGDRIEFALSDTGLVGTTPTRLRLQIDPESMSLVEGTVNPEGAVTQTPKPVTE